MRWFVAALCVTATACGIAPPVETDSPPDAGTTGPDAGENAPDAGNTDVPDAGDPTPDAGAPPRFVDPPLLEHDMERGQSGLDVGLLQFELKLATNANLDEDGRFGPATQSLLNRFQASVSLPSTSVADETTRTKLHEKAVESALALAPPADDEPPFAVPSTDVIAANVAAVQVIHGQGDKTGTYNGRVGFSWGDGAEGTSIRQGSPAHLDWVASLGTTASERRVIGVISRNEGPFDAVNSYDAGNYTWGAYQLIGSYRTQAYDPGDDELSQGLAAMKRLDPPAFFRAFQRFGLDVEATWNDDVLARSSVRVSLKLPDGTVLTGKQVWERVGTDTTYNQIFINAGADLAIQRAEILAAKAVHFDALDAPLDTGRPAMRAYLTSERAVCAFLDQELNRGRSSTIRIYKAAVDEVATQHAVDALHPENWPENDRRAVEADVLQAVLARAPTTAYGDRLRRVLNSVFVSDEARSFEPLR